MKLITFILALVTAVSAAVTKLPANDNVPVFTSGPLTIYGHGFFNGSTIATPTGNSRWQPDPPPSPGPPQQHCTGTDIVHINSTVPDSPFEDDCKAMHDYLLTVEDSMWAIQISPFNPRWGYKLIKTGDCAIHMDIPQHVNNDNDWTWVYVGAVDLVYLLTYAIEANVNAPVDVTDKKRLSAGGDITCEGIEAGDHWNIHWGIVKQDYY
ncbi:hypothetical protein QBC35DRAFT_476958 [Podospora australis]|uniref:Ecp2 effector protein-like domain-containing protein n=1 Tax=Podospora australis TaxID=1536484 RepID=A0AAN6WR17_9PEZI|nr:hypothetical protein QBC35DRAFT_476958 [Podospora australis]